MGLFRRADGRFLPELMRFEGNFLIVMIVSAIALEVHRAWAAPRQMKCLPVVLRGAAENSLGKQRDIGSGQTCRTECTVLKRRASSELLEVN